MMDCKRALEEAAGDMERAVALLREKGLSVAAKKSGRLASEGLVAAHLSADRRQGALVEVNCETDFVANNGDFVAFVRDLAAKAAASDALAQTAEGEGQALSGLQMAGGTVAEALTGLVARIGENMTIRRYARFAPAGPALLESYIHMGGKIGVLIELGHVKPETAKNDAFLALAKDLAMQVAAARPEYIRREDVPAATVERERAIFKTQAMNEGKPEHVAEKIVNGRVEKFFKEICLLEQAFIKDANQTCAQLIKSIAAQLGEEITVRRFARFERGEGLAKRQHDLAAEVRAQLEQ